MADSEIPFLPFDVDIVFPDPEEAEGDVVASGGNLSPGMLLSAYRRGIFPWFSDEDPILWWSLNPRFVIFPGRLHVSRSLRKRIRRKPFRLSLDKAFDEVIEACSGSSRPDQEGTWITEGMVAAYKELHSLGFAHSVEAWSGDSLAGGLYGVSLGGCFYGESMFARENDASKVAFTALAGTLVDAGFGLIDCQQHTRHLGSFGAVDMPRGNFLRLLETEIDKETLRGDWGHYFPDFPDSTLWRELVSTSGQSGSLPLCPEGAESDIREKSPSGTPGGGAT